MPAVNFNSLPSDARVWVFAADAPLNPDAQRALFAEVDVFLETWNAHGHPLVCARDWRDERFLAVGVDQSTAGASGCSIDGMFRVLQRIQPAIGASLLPGPRVYWRDASGGVQAASRPEFAKRANAGEVGPATSVFDTAVMTAADWRERFERRAEESWHRALLPASVR